MQRPPYDRVPPADTLGLRHLRVALDDVEYPTKTSTLRDRLGHWRMPRTGAEFQQLAAYLEGVPEREFFNADEVAAAVARVHPELRE